jgi:hypothetical protein
MTHICVSNTTAKDVNKMPGDILIVARLVAKLRVIVTQYPHSVTVHQEQT